MIWFLGGRTNAALKEAVDVRLPVALVFAVQREETHANTGPTLFVDDAHRHRVDLDRRRGKCDANLEQLSGHRRRAVGSNEQAAVARIEDFHFLGRAKTHDLRGWRRVGTDITTALGTGVGFHDFVERREALAVKSLINPPPCIFHPAQSTAAKETGRPPIFAASTLTSTQHAGPMNLIEMNKLTRELPVRRSTPADAGGRPRLLLVEDEDALRQALIRTLNEVFDVTAVADGAAAADLLVKETYDGVLSDIGLPGMSGVDLLRLVRTYDLDVPVVLMTGQPSVETAVAALELGALTYIQKPFAHDVLTNTLVRAAKLSKLARAKREAVAAGLGGSTITNDRTGLNTSLDRALETLSMHFQPIVDRRAKKTMGFEALMRSKEPTLPHPGAILEAAERLDRIQEVGRRVRELAASGFHPPDDDMTLFINLHPKDLQDSNLYDRHAPLTKLADHVVLEITERAALDDVTETKHRATELRRRGFKLALDDLGAGYAGLTSFATFEPEVVKLDMSLIRGIEASPVKKHIVESMTKLCRDLDMRVVAEGIETMLELACILDLGCDYLQGYLLGRPGPAIVSSTLTW
jgi:EAL domain-containing protein (putative c-di-GMP-specific phosphodiesterase class I)